MRVDLKGLIDSVSICYFLAGMFHSESCHNTALPTNSSGGVKSKLKVSGGARVTLNTVENLFRDLLSVSGIAVRHWCSITCGPLAPTSASSHDIFPVSRVRIQPYWIKSPYAIMALSQLTRLVTTLHFLTCSHSKDSKKEMSHAVFLLDQVEQQRC